MKTEMMRKMKALGLAGVLALTTVFTGCGKDAGGAVGASGTANSDTAVGSDAATVGDTDANGSGDAASDGNAAGSSDEGAAAAEMTTVGGYPAVAIPQNHETVPNTGKYRNYYEIFVGSFYDGDGDGHGDLKGVTQQLDYIADLDFDGIWLMPVSPSPTYHKYDVTDYCDVDESYGTVEDFAELVQEAHARGISVIIDMVINHTSSQHPWFKEAKDYLRSLAAGEEPDATACPYVDYYHFSYGQPGSDWYRVIGTDYFYEGVFWSEMPDLNLESEAVRGELHTIADFWLDLGVDGFRMDAAMHYDETDLELNLDVLNDLYTYCQSKNPDFYMVSEVWAAESTIAKYYESGTDSFFNFDLAQAEGKLIRAARGRFSAKTLAEALAQYGNDFSVGNPDYIDAPFLTNHDMGRVSNALNNKTDAIKRAGGLLMICPGNPFVYYGEEIGMPSKGNADENKRLPMLWSTDGTEGEGGMARRPEGAEYGIKSAFEGVQEQLLDPESILNYYRRALQLRRENPELAYGSLSVDEVRTTDEVGVLIREAEDSRIYVVFNLSSDPVTVDFSGADVTLYSTLTLSPSEEITFEGGSLQLPGGGIAVLR